MIIIRILVYFSYMDLSQFNFQQQSAINAPLGPVLVLAGAGSGKTRVLTYRLLHLIEQGLFQPSSILALTFTNKAAREMKQRVIDLIGSAADLPFLGTFHAFGVRLLRAEGRHLGLRPGFTIFDSEDQLRLLRSILQDIDLPKPYTAHSVKAYISAAKNRMQTPETFSLGLPPFLELKVAEIFARYQDSLWQQGGVDFDDLLLLPIKLFEAMPDVLAKYQKRFQYILVDEYQDTNAAQYRFLQLLAAHRNLFVVGDDAQSIYGFRGSTVANILHFEKDYPDASVYLLEQNYRSTKHILAVADSVISINENQRPKKVWTDNGSGEKVVVKACENERLEAEFVTGCIINLATGKPALPDEEEMVEEAPRSFSILDQFLHKAKYKNQLSAARRLHLQLPAKHAPLSQFAILYRTHAQSRALEELFLSARVPYRIVGGLRFYERKEIKDLLAYARLLANPFDWLSFTRAIAEPGRGVGEKSLSKIQPLLAALNVSGQELPTQDVFNKLTQNLPTAGLPAKARTGAGQFISLLQGVLALDPALKLSVILEHLFKQSGLKAALQDGTEQGEERIQNVQELLAVAEKYQHESWSDALQAFLEEVTLMQEGDSSADEVDTVTLMTLHSAKGLEFDTVFFVGLEEGILPHSRSLIDPEELAEEIRLAYVGITRARKRLFLVYAEERSLYGGDRRSLPSRILRVLPLDSVDNRAPMFHRFSEGEVSYEPLSDF